MKQELVHAWKFINYKNQSNIRVGVGVVRRPAQTVVLWMLLYM
jgi:hypothetical protein